MPQNTQRIKHLFIFLFVAIRTKISLSEGWAQRYILPGLPGSALFQTSLCYLHPNARKHPIKVIRRKKPKKLSEVQQEI